jgi:hypothetical protein
LLARLLSLLPLPLLLQVGDLMPALKGRFNDSNKNLIALVLALLAKLAKAMGRAIVREARPVLGPALRCLCDSKPFVSVPQHSNVVCLALCASWAWWKRSLVLPMRCGCYW